MMKAKTNQTITVPGSLYSEDIEDLFSGDIGDVIDDLIGVKENIEEWFVKEKQGQKHLIEKIHMDVDDWSDSYSSIDIVLHYTESPQQVVKRYQDSVADLLRECIKDRACTVDNAASYFRMQKAIQNTNKDSVFGGLLE